MIIIIIIIIATIIIINIIKIITIITTIIILLRVRGPLRSERHPPFTASSVTHTALPATPYIEDSVLELLLGQRFRELTRFETHNRPHLVPLLGFHRMRLLVRAGIEAQRLVLVVRLRIRDQKS